MGGTYWVIKVTYLKNDEVNFNEGYTSYERCMSAIRKKINYGDMKRINEYTYEDLESEIVYEAKLVDIIN